MGLGFVLLIGIVLCGCAAVPIGAVLAYVSWQNSGSSGWARAGRVSRAIRAAGLPVLLIAGGLVWFAVYATYCETVRGVDPGIGDSARVPLAHGYFFCMSDSSVFVMKNGCSGAPLLDDVRQIAMAGDLVVGAGADAPGFVLDTRTGGLTRLPDSAAALARVPSAAPLRSPNEFYLARRWGWQDAVAALVLLALLIGPIGFWYRRFLRPPAAV